MVLKLNTHYHQGNLLNPILFENVNSFTWIVSGKDAEHWQNNVIILLQC